MRSRVSRVAAAVIFDVAVGGVALWFHGSGATFAYAYLIRPILEAKTTPARLDMDSLLLNLFMKLYLKYPPQAGQ
jgi:hypothetical protein